MIAVIVPAHDEEALIARCLEAMKVAARHPGLVGERVEIVVVADTCTDRTAEIASQHGVACIAVHERNVGAARAAGATAMLAAGARWLAFSDADSEVEPDWLAHQTASTADAVCGIVTIDDWGGHSPQVRLSYEAAYVDAEAHRHVHGASFGVSATAYTRAGGFPSLACSEDVALIERLETTGAQIWWTNRVRVRTSARTVARAPGGFAAHLRGLVAPSEIAELVLAPAASGASLDIAPDAAREPGGAREW